MPLLTVNARPPSLLSPNRYVVGKDMRLNTVSISRQYHAPEKRRDAFAAGPFNWLSERRPAAGGSPLLVKVRHGPNTAGCQVLLGSAGRVAAWAAAAAAVGAAAEARAAGEGGEGAAAASAAATEWRVEDILSHAAAAGGVGSEEQRRQEERPAAGEEEYGLVLLEERDQGLAAGQYAVLYQGGICLGSAKILGAVGATEAAEALAGAAGGGA